MEQKILNLLNESNDSKFVTKKKGNYDVGNELSIIKKF